MWRSSAFRISHNKNLYMPKQGTPYPPGCRTKPGITEISLQGQLKIWCKLRLVGIIEFLLIFSNDEIIGYVMAVLMESLCTVKLMEERIQKENPIDFFLIIYAMHTVLIFSSQFVLKLECNE